MTKTIRPMARGAAAVTTAITASVIYAGTGIKKTEPSIFHSDRPNLWPRSTQISLRHRRPQFRPFLTFLIRTSSGRNERTLRRLLGRWFLWHQQRLQSSTLRLENRHKILHLWIFQTGVSALTFRFRDFSALELSLIPEMHISSLRCLKWSAGMKIELLWWQ